MTWKPPLEDVYEMVSNILENDEGLTSEEVIKGATMAENAVKLFYETL